MRRQPRESHAKISLLKERQSLGNQWEKLLSRVAAIPAVPKPGSNDELRTPEWRLARRVVASQSFAKSVFLTNFLLYVCDRKLRGREAEISEYQIGIQALGRPESYQPSEDNIVRNYARMLRKRLDEFFAGEGKLEPVRIVIPRGQYVPIFEPNCEAFVEPCVVPEPIPVSFAPLKAALPFAETRPTARRRLMLALCAGSLLLLLAGWWIERRTTAEASTYASYHQFWSQIFAVNRQCFVVTGDSGFAMLQDMTGHEVHLHEYATGEVDSEFPAIALSAQPSAGRFGADRFSNYSSTADLSVVAGLSRVPEYLRLPVTVRYARDMRMDDLKHSNVVLIGGPHANPWVELFEARSAFKMKFPLHLKGQHLDERAVLNKQPRPGELSEYSNSLGEEPHNTYTILSFVPSVDGTGWALLLQGQNMAGTEAAGDFVLSQDAMRPVLEKARHRDGSIGSFEIVLKTQTIGADAPKAQVILERYEGH